MVLRATARSADEQGFSDSESDGLSVTESDAEQVRAGCSGGRAHGVIMAVYRCPSVRECPRPRPRLLSRIHVRFCPAKCYRVNSVID